MDGPGGRADRKGILDHSFFLSPYYSIDNIVACWYVGETDDEGEANVDVVKETINVVVDKVHWDVTIQRLTNKRPIQLGTEVKLFQEPQEKQHAPGERFLSWRLRPRREVLAPHRVHIQRVVAVYPVCPYPGGGSREHRRSCVLSCGCLSMLQWGSFVI